MSLSGKVVILAVAGVALAGASFSWWYAWQTTHRAAGFWGADAATMISHPDHVRAVRFRDGIAEEQQVTKARGISNLRHALLQDVSFEWDDLTTDLSTSDTQDGHELRLSRKDQTLHIRFTDDFQRLEYTLSESADAPTRRRVGCVAPIADGLRVYFTELWGSERGS